MSNQSVIPFKFTDTHSRTDRFECDGITTESGRCDAVNCNLKKESPTVLWNCLAIGTLGAVNKTNEFSYHVLVWQQFPLVLRPSREGESNALTAVGQPKPEKANGEVNLEIVEDVESWTTV
ncbi:hypothetical protein L596_013203 [Steinernema carpocapsae]|uniref:Uncharacterized protein n=1 Tax=Steinernema carpocapsae TaxID=34508 RepID=A0A4U5P0A0_STECR|nr:hypothetical protein L596_013203 [Steinernema carpocapsae]